MTDYVYHCLGCNALFKDPEAHTCEPVATLDRLSEVMELLLSRPDLAVETDAITASLITEAQLPDAEDG